MSQDKKEKDVTEISFTQDLTKESLAELKQTIMNLHNKGQEILLTIQSSGGDPFAAFGFYDWIKTHNISLTTLSLGNTNSAAIILFLAGTKRLAAKHTRFYFHEFTTSFKEGVSFSVSELQQIARDRTRDQRTYIKIVSEATGKSEKEIRKLLKDNITFTAKKARKFGLAHEIA